MIQIRHRLPKHSTASGHRFLKLALAASALALLIDAEAGRVERVKDKPWGAVELAVPGIEEGRWRTRTQLVWDSVEAKLTRRVYQIWDPLPSLDLEVIWKPKDTHTDHSGPVAGKGTLLWVRRGAPSYDASATIASYVGHMRDGRAHGEGSYRHASGLIYRGEWRQGLMDGHGRLLLPNGDEYVGGFRNGLSDGRGVYLDSWGNIYEGMFASGQRNGEGAVIPAGAVPYRAQFRAGIEVAGTRVSFPMSGRSGLSSTSRYRSYEDARIGVIVDKIPVLPVHGGEKELAYTFANERERLFIFPDHQRLMSIWRGRAEVQLTPDEEHGHALTQSILDGSIHFASVPLIIEFENLSPRTARVVEAFLDVKESATDTEPYIQVSVGVYDLCALTGGEYSSIIQFENFGWTPAENAKIEFAFTDAERRKTVGPGSRLIGTIDKTLEVDFLHELERAGVQLALPGSERFACSSDDDYRCAQEIAATGVLGSLGDLVWLRSINFLVNVRGTLHYDWRDTDGAVHHKTSRFTVPLVLARKKYHLECGEGGEPRVIRHDPFRFQLGRKDYWISVPLLDDIPPGVTARWRIRLDAERSSKHFFRVVLKLADGREVASRPIQLLFFRPSTIDYLPGGDGA